MFQAFADLFSPLLHLLGKTGKIGGLVALLLGVGLVVVGLDLTFDEDRYWPLMSAVCIAGLVFAALGAGVLFGSQARLAAALDAVEPVHEPAPREQALELARASAPPFWVCSDCRCVEPGVSITARCTRCGRVAAFVQVGVEAERRTAIACLS